MSVGVGNSASPGPPGQIDHQPALVWTVAICTRNRAPLLTGAIQSVLPQLDPASELLVVDNGSSDQTPDLLATLAAQQARFRVWREPQAGVAAARNAALRHARGQYVAFLDDDAVAEAGWLAAYQALFRRPPVERIGCVGGPSVAQYEVPPPGWLEPQFGSINLAETSGALNGVTSPGAGNCAYARGAALQAGGFSPDLIRREDSDLNARLRRAGWVVWWLTEARVRHLIGRERFRLRAQMAYWWTEGAGAAQMRLGSCPPGGARRLLWLGRSLGTPLQAAGQLLGALGCLVSWRRRRACRLLLRTSRTLGFFAQLQRETW